MTFVKSISNKGIMMKKIVCVGLICCLLAACPNKEEELCQKEFMDVINKKMAWIGERFQKHMPVIQAEYNSKKAEVTQKWKDRSCVARRTDGINEAEKIAEELHQFAFRKKYF
jgi:hypothetical protein